MVMGIDPGLHGGIVILDENQKIIFTSAMPLTKEGTIDSKEFQHILHKLHNGAIVVVEDVHSIFGASAKSNFMFGKVCGIIEALVTTVGNYSVHYAAPKAWQKRVWQEGDIALKNGKKDTKKTSLNAAIRLTEGKALSEFRKSERAKLPHDGIVDAYLIAYSYSI